LDSPVHGIAVIQLLSPFVTTLSVHHTTTQSVEGITIVHEFPDVFSEDLSGMLPDRDIEFIIELQPCTTLISRQLYKMTPNELAELKM
jgi:hypothetical protein